MDIVASGPAVGLGITVAGVSSNVEFTDGLYYIFPEVFEGQALFVGASYAFVGFGFGYSAVQLGDAHSIGRGWQIGWDVSVSGGAGISTVANVSWESCCEG